MDRFSVCSSDVLCNKHDIGGRLWNHFLDLLFHRVGILSIPKMYGCRFKELSLTLHAILVLLFVIASASFYTGLLIRRCMDADSKMRTYPDIGEQAFGNKDRIVVTVVMCLELYLVVTSFLILEGDNLHNLLPEVGFEVAGLRIGGRQSFIILVAIIILPSVWLDNLSILSYISATGVLASVIILGSTFWVGAFDGIEFHQKGTTLNWSGIPTAVSLYAFCYCSHPVFPTLYTSMRNKHQFTNVLLLFFLFSTSTYASMAVLGYSMFGSNIQSQITLDLPTNKLGSKVSICTALVNPVSKYALMITPVVNSIESWCCCNKRPLSFLIKTTLVISTVVVALAVPFFGDLMSLVGATHSMSHS